MSNEYDHYIRIRVTKEQKEKIQAASKEKDMTISELIRSIIFKLIR